MKPALVICRTPAALPYLRRLRISAPLVVASDDPGVREEAGGMPNVQGLSDLERAESFYSVSTDVCQLLDTINAHMVSLAPIEKGAQPEALSWGRNVEGGLLNQRIQDALLLIRSYQDVFRTSDATEVHILLEPKSYWEDLVLAKTADAIGLDCRCHATRLLSARFVKIQAALRPWAVAAYYLVNILRSGGCRRTRAPLPSSSGNIVFQLCSALPKHVENIAPLMASLAERGQRPLALCWTSSERKQTEDAVSQLAKRALTAVRLESWVKLTDIKISITAAWRASRRFKQSLSKRAPWKELIYRGVHLDSLLAESVRHFFVAELPQRIRYQRAFASCSAELRPIALKLSGGPESFEGQIALRRWSRPLRPFIFHYWLGASFQWPYADGAGQVDLFLAKGLEEARHGANDYALAENQIVVVGQSRFSGYAEFATRVSAEDSRQALAFPSGRLYIGWDPNRPIRGYQSVGEQTKVLAVLLQAARANRNLVIVIKPHPSSAISHLNPLLDQAALENVFVLQGNSSLKDFLNATDIVVTKYSTLILEAALMGRPSIAALFDGEDRFKVFGEIACTIKSAEELSALLGELAEDPEKFSAWRDHELDRHQRLLRQFYHRAEIDPAILSADAICQSLRKFGHPLPPIDDKNSA